LKPTARGALFLLLMLGTTSPAAAGGLRGVHQESVRLTRTMSAFAVPDGLLTLGLRGALYHPREITDVGLPDYAVWQWDLTAEYAALPGLALRYEQSFRSWSQWTAEPASGSGLADGRFDAVLAAPGLPSWLGVSLDAGSSVPVGAPEIGEDALSSHAVATVGLRFWEHSVLPEMRLQASYGHRWNANEARGYGVHLGAGPQPWWPRYPDAASAGGDANNDQRLWSAALEFRRASTSFWVEYFAAELYRAEDVSPREYDTSFSAGVRWGLAEGWAANLSHTVLLHRDDVATAYKPELPDIVMSFGFARQFSLGGHDADHDGIPDRKDRCVGDAEDRDGFADEDGCPDPDNDGDGILDAVDDCPDAAEDRDGFADLDGCPDLDNDGDGIVDARDACPDEPENFDGHRDADGCPDVFVDSDGDTIGDDTDLCPHGAEDLDGFEDADGCPDPDNDLDGIADAQDQCPNEAEDYDGVRDDDGCPDRD
jgi:hypothetical protein